MPPNANPFFSDALNDARYGFVAVLPAVLKVDNGFQMLKNEAVRLDRLFSPSTE
jgi:hypothetical protein